MVSTEQATDVTTRQIQGTFSKAEKAFMSTYLPRYLALENNVKGEKKLWVKKHVFESYVREFGSDGPNGVQLHSLLEVSNFMCAAFLDNQGICLPENGAVVCESVSQVIENETAAIHGQSSQETPGQEC